MVAAMATRTSSGSEERLSSYNPATGELLGTVPIFSAADVEASVSRAQLAAEIWSTRSHATRADELDKFRHVLAAEADTLAEILHRENGKPEVEALTEVMMSLGHLKHAAAIAASALATKKVSSGLLANFRATVSYHPLGVVGVIGPWNFPINTPMGSIAYALAAGNAVVWKPSELTPLIALEIEKIAARTFALPDLLQVVTGAGSTGAALARSAVHKISFTGSAATGKRVMLAAAERLTPVLMELGGKDAMIITEDADLEKAAEAAVYGGLSNAGQACVAVERVYVSDTIHDAFVAEVVKQVKQLKVGGDDGHLGAMTSEAQVSIVRDHLEDAVKRGAKVHTGGPGAISGRFIQPTVLTNVNHEMKIMVEETFGPVIPIQKVRSIDEAIRLANDSRFGLGSSVFANKSARSIADRMRAGMTSINSVMAFAGIYGLPFGGVGESGFGRIHGEEGLREFSRVKATAEQAFSLPMNMMSFRQKGDLPKQLRGMIKNLYGDGVISKAGDLLRKIRH